MNILPGEAWAFVTARGGSKSIPLKNIHPVAGRPLMGYCLAAARRAATIGRVICNTDHEAIAQVAREHGADIQWRPEELGGDLVNSVDVVVEGVQRLLDEEGQVAEIIVLVQPTSIFLTAANIDDAVNALLADPEAQGSQTVIRVPHQFHAHNQRRMSGDGRDIWFEFPEERAKGYSKQTKPAFYCYGNLIITKARPLLEERTLFPRPCASVVIPLEQAYDLDGWDDIPMAELMIERGMVAPEPPLSEPLPEDER